MFTTSPYRVGFGSFAGYPKTQKNPNVNTQDTPTSQDRSVVLDRSRAEALVKSDPVKHATLHHQLITYTTGVIDSPQSGIKFNATTDETRLRGGMPGNILANIPEVSFVKLAIAASKVVARGLEKTYNLIFHGRFTTSDRIREEENARREVSLRDIPKRQATRQHIEIVNNNIFLEVGQIGSNNFVRELEN